MTNYCDQLNMAVLFCCYNRKTLSIRCVRSLIEAASMASEVNITIHVWDDGSNDNTAEALEEISDRIRVYRGPGNYYWSKSMNAVMMEAKKTNPDLYLMVNDDVSFYMDFICILLNDYKRAGGKCGIVGSTEFEGEFTYGGHDKEFNDVPPEGSLISCRYANWNCFLIDRYVVEIVGLISEHYSHSFGDFDYSSRMIRNGIPLYVASQYICSIYWNYHL